MDRLEKYRQIIQNLLSEYAQKGGDAEVEAQLLFDTQRDHYQMIYVGWHQQKRIFGPVLYFNIREGKIWIQWNGTEDDIAAQLEAQGVPKQDIVIGFLPPIMRQYTDYAVGELI